MKNTKTTYQKLEVYKCSSLHVRAGASTNHKVIGYLYPKQVVEVESRKGNWARIKWKGSFAFCSLLYLRAITTSSSSPVRAMIMTTTMSINIRTAPNWSASIIEAVKKGTELYVTEYVAGDNWSTIWYNNQYAYVPSKYLRDTGRVVEGVGGGDGEDTEDTIPNLPEFAEAPRYNVEYKNKWWIECYSPEHPEFFFNTSNLGMPLLEKPVEQLPIMKVDATEEIDFDGDIIHTNATYSTTEMELEFFILKENYNLVMHKLRQLCQMKEFRLICGWDNRYYKKARLSSSIEIEEYDFDELGYKITIEFIMQPYRYAMDGTKFIKDRKTGKDDLVNESEIYNSFAVSLPKIYVQVPHESLVDTNTDNEKIITLTLESDIDDTSSEIVLYAHNESYEGIPNKYVHLVIDCENEVIYEDTTNKNYNYLLSLNSEFPILKPKLTTVKLCEQMIKNNCQVKIVPNWREF